MAKCYRLLEGNETMGYSIGLMEQQLALLKNMQVGKVKDNNRLSDKIKARANKEVEVRRHLKLEDDRIRKLAKGLKNLNA